MKSEAEPFPPRLRKWIIAFAFIGFLVGLGIGAFVTHKQHTAGSATPPVIPEASN
ncbi:hypothetical protein [uncultured Pontibacter sp.]|uniref:hypothetical protein n=1 Tax=uncultured Pontibacter sp. TaxID=453356 RepID=UPI00260B6D13|nr:hypothetical protein [uncultured Pontibacter sp.]